MADRRAASRHPALATTGASGPEARVVVLRAANRSLSTVTIYTDLRSAKINDLKMEPCASLLIWEQKTKLQIRLRVHVEITSGNAVAEPWRRVPNAARKVYGNHPAPGTIIDQPEHLTSEANREAFAVLTCRIIEIETLYLGQNLHRRAKFCVDSNWMGSWLAP